MPPVGFESTISLFDQAKTVHALDRTVTVGRPTNVIKGVKYLCLMVF
jgi:hypothetical protein